MGETSTELGGYFIRHNIYQISTGGLQEGGDLGTKHGETSFVVKFRSCLAGNNIMFILLYSYGQQTLRSLVGLLPNL